MAPTLTSDAEGRLHCGVCGYAAMAVSGVDKVGKLIPAEMRDGIPIFVVCVLCRRYWEHCDRPCTTFAAQRPPRTPKETPPMPTTIALSDGSELVVDKSIETLRKEIKKGLPGGEFVDAVTEDGRPLVVIRQIAARLS